MARQTRLLDLEPSYSLFLEFLLLSAPCGIIWYAGAGTFEVGVAK
jgi:hypothetical protein